MENGKLGSHPAPRDVLQTLRRGWRILVDIKVLQ